jgi:cytochrome c553
LLATLLAAGTAVAQTTPAKPATVANTLEQRLVACAICHGKQGEGVRKNEYYPRLAGKPSEYLYNQLLGFREKRRASPVMTYMVGGLSDSYLGEIADYYAALRPPFPPPAQRADPAKLARGEALALKGDPVPRNSRVRRVPRRQAQRNAAWHSGLDRPLSRLHRRANGRVEKRRAQCRRSRLHGAHRLPALRR